MESVLLLNYNMLYTITAITGNEVTLNKQPPSTAYWNHNGLIVDAVVLDKLNTIIISESMQKQFALKVGSEVHLDDNPKIFCKPTYTFPDWSTIVTTKDSDKYRLIVKDDTSPLQEYNLLEIGGAYLYATIQNLEIAHFKVKQNKALRYNEWKIRWSLVDWKSMEPMVQVLEFGAKKYEEENWKKPMDKTQILNSAIRHLIAMMNGEENDPESGLPHVGHLMCNSMFYSFHSK